MCIFYFSLVGSAFQQYSGAAEVFHFFMPYVCTQVSSCLLSVKTPPPTSQPQPPPPVTLYERCLWAYSKHMQSTMHQSLQVRVELHKAIQLYLLNIHLHWWTVAIIWLFTSFRNGGGVNIPQVEKKKSLNYRGCPLICWHRTLQAIYHNSLGDFNSYTLLEPDWTPFTCRIAIIIHNRLQQGAGNRCWVIMHHVVAADGHPWCWSWWLESTRVTWQWFWCQVWEWALCISSCWKRPSEHWHTVVYKGMDIRKNTCVRRPK